MLLVIANEDDVLADAIFRQRPDAMRVNEATLFGDCRFGLELNANRASGWLELDGRRLDFSALTGVVMRLSLSWLPSGFDLKDSIFVLHETRTAWIAVSHALQCPVVNRFGVGWWTSNPAYPLDLRGSLASALGITEVEEPVERSCFLAGPRIVGDRNLLERRAAAIAAWQALTGISLCRLDFAAGGLAAVDPYPSPEAQLLDRLARISHTGE